jgi:hypothetical protein
MSVDCQEIHSSTFFHTIIDSGCIEHMFPYQDSFITYKATPGSFVVLADKSKDSHSGIGTICFHLGGKKVM